MRNNKNCSKFRSLLKKYSILVLGCALLAFGDAAFISPLNLVTGGVLSIGVITQHFVTLAGSDFYVVDIVTWIIQILMLIVSFLFLGKKFTLRTIFATLLYPALFTFFIRVPLINGVSIGNHLASFFLTEDTDWGLRTLAGIAGGAFIGAGVGVCYHAGGSTGGLDVISAILARKTPIKEGVSAFIFDGTLVIAGMIVMRDIRNGLVGVLGALVCAMTVQVLYVNTQSFVIADIISEKWEVIQDYVHNQMDRSTTVIDVTGGYSKEGKKILRVAFSKRELLPFRAFIGQTDPKAFVTFTQASMINGEGFDPLVRTNFDKKKGE
ncbi:MAG: YitT family protein [Bacilli bacterium]|nr:YitT family protein [Bacilli bacterium]